VINRPVGAKHPANSSQITILPHLRVLRPEIFTPPECNRRAPPASPHRPPTRRGGPLSPARFQRASYNSPGIHPEASSPGPGDPSKAHQPGGEGGRYTADTDRTVGTDGVEAGLGAAAALGWRGFLYTDRTDDTEMSNRSKRYLYVIVISNVLLVLSFCGWCYAVGVVTGIALMQEGCISTRELLEWKI